MASLFGSPSFLSNPIQKTHHFSSFHPPTQSLRLPSSEPALPCEKVQQKQTIDESTDFTRRFGLGAGLVWAGFHSFSVLSKQMRNGHGLSLRDVEDEEEVVLPNGIRYYELRVGSGSSPRPGDMVVIDIKGKVKGTDQPFVNTFGCQEKPLALLMGSRPYSKGMCEGIEYISRSMKGGGKRRVIVPPNLGFGKLGIELGHGLQIPPNATLDYIVEVDRALA